MCRAYFRDRKMMVAMLMVFYGTLFGIGYLYRIEMEKIRYIALFSGTIILILLFCDFYFYMVKWKELKSFLEQKANYIDMFHTKGTEIDKMYRELICQMNTENQKIIEEEDYKRKNMMDYYSFWAHQIKTPIAAMRIVLQSSREQIRTETDKETYNSLTIELFRIEQYVAMVLSYLKIGDITRDMVLKEQSVENMVKQAVKKYSRLFILQKISLCISDIEETVITDEKWMVFVLEQILSNALKYTKKGKISIYMERPGVLVIEDTGIGISPEDLPRVLEKGFTGYNGRKDKKSTGIGLYLCKTVLEKLNHKIWLESEVDKGTKVFLDLNREPLCME